MNKEIGVRPGPYLVRTQWNTNTRTGDRLVHTWRGSPAECESKRFFELQLGATDVSIQDLGDGNSELVAQFGANGDQPGFEMPTNMHELEVVQSHESFWLSPYLRQTFVTNAGVRADIEMGACNQVCEKWHKGDYADEDPSPEEAAIADINKYCTAAPATAAAVFRQYAYGGLQHYQDERCVYRRTITLGNVWMLRASYSGTGMIWTSAEIAVFEGLPPLWSFALPQKSVWLKSRPRVVAAAGQKTQISYTYTESAAASVLLYAKWGSATPNNYYWTAP